MRRLLLIFGAAVTALVSFAPTTWAAESISSGSWAGSALDAGPTGTSSSAYSVSGTFQHQYNRRVQITVSASPPGDGACAIRPVVLDPASAPTRFAATLYAPCNGTYNIVATAVTTENNAFFAPESASLDRRIAVSAPPPTVTGVSAQAQGRSIEITWDDVSPMAPDTSNYVVERRLDDAAFEHLANVPVDRQSFVDNGFPASAGQASYRVFAVRPSPQGQTMSAASSEASAPYTAAPTSTTGSGAGGTTATPGGTSGTSGSTTGGGPAGSGGVASTPGGTPGGVSAPRVYSGTFLPPLLRPATQTLSPPTTADTGFEESLPYEQGPNDAVLPGGESLASIDTHGQAGRGLVIPVATALVLAIWAVHLRMLARAARPIS